MDPDVIVVGAGPVGMTAAALLHRAGVTVRILERQTKRPQNPRAATIHPRTLEVLDALPAAHGSNTHGHRATLGAQLAAAGTPMPATHFAALPSLLSYERLDTSYPFVLMCPQPITERVLAEHLTGAGVAIETGVEIVDVDQDDDGIVVHDTNHRAHRARYVIGADGAHSAVRHATDITFPGTTATLAGFGADGVLDRLPERRHQWDPVRGSLSVLTFPNGLHRVFGIEPSETNLADEDARRRQAHVPDVEEIKATLRRVAGDDFGLHDVVWTGRTGDVTRHADRYRSGRILLAGDAAHVHFPAGGQGLNVGVQDAANLAWKLAAEIAGWAPDRLVRGAQSYDAERRPVGEQLASNTQAQSAVMHTFSPSGAALRDLMSELIAQDGDTAEHLRGWLSGLSVRYPAPGTTPGEEHPRAGTRVPDLPLSDGRTLHPALRPDVLTLVSIGAIVPPSLLSKVPGDRLQLLHSVRSWGDAAGALVRPDGYTAAVWDHVTDPELIAQTARSWVATTQT
ncbi:FAD-dependent monooxygenase [Allobranchiibius huperziae]|uniref:2-polyprenyl-6-methoxyphenol hydroxylase-like FAD-dependent oxidoreductase n=1 Tax=Allobranchiibius huperziae TaxID=1874116 RepID=A0A853DIN6_9MICO|nr:FAD-dependent monooxygenase [Allobranchiibius huperziae]NYJ76567.1 2-polyprenyl-6-methoxyphenol hydroxylase-like FAD-dependent oxidoreductase [Allobranchiibius huperziae]